MSRWIQAGAVCVGVAMVVAGVRGLRSQREKPEPLPSPRNNQEMIEFARIERERQDQRILEEHRSQPEAEVYAALVRLGKAQDPQARTLALKLASSDRALLRAGAATALGNFEDPVIRGKLQSLVEDSDERVRDQAILALGAQAGAERLSFLEGLLSKNGFPVAGRVAASAAIYRIADGAVRERALSELIKIARQGAGGVPENGVELKALHHASALAARDSRVLELLRQMILKGKNPALSANAIRHLSVVGDAWLGKNLVKLIQERNAAKKSDENEISDVGSALMAAFRFVCVPDRARRLEELAEKKIPRAKEELGAIRAMRAPDPCDKPEGPKGQ